MGRKTLRIARACRQVAAVSLLTGFVLAVCSTAPAYADSPHVRSTDKTSTCVSCHSAHDVAGAPTRGPLNTAAGPSGLCIACHDGSDSTASNIVSGSVDSFGMSSGHVLVSGKSGSAPIASCDTCHDPHGASSTTPRIPAKQVNGIAVSSAGKDLCLACHDSKNSWYGPGYPSTSAPRRDAAGFPVSGTWPGPATYASPTNAHNLIPESTRTVGASEPIRREQGDCLYCHAAHGAKNAYDALVTTFTVPTRATLSADKSSGSYAALCFTCHGGSKPSGFATAPVDIKQFATASGGSGGHSIVTSGGTLPVGAPLPCFECHNPHGSKRGNASLISDERGASLDTTSAADVRAFCFTCHTTSDTKAGWDSAATKYAPVSSADKIVGLPRDGAALHLPARDGHAEGDSASCYDCHGNGYGSGGNNVHDPGDGSSSLKGLALTIGVLSSDVATISVDATSSVEPSGSVVGSETVAASATVGASAGDASSAAATPSSAADTTDTTAPTTVSDAQPSYVGTATIRLTAVDNAGGVGVAETHYRLDGGAPATGTVVTTSTPGPHTLAFWSVDVAGNAEAAKTVTFTVAIAPAPSFQPILAVRRGGWIASFGA